SSRRPTSFTSIRTRASIAACASTSARSTRSSRRRTCPRSGRLSSRPMRVFTRSRSSDGDGACRRRSVRGGIEQAASGLFVEQEVKIDQALVWGPTPEDSVHVAVGGPHLELQPSLQLVLAADIAR